MAERGEVVSVNISERKGTVKHPVDAIRLSEQGVAGDAHAGVWQRQVSLLGWEDIEAFSERAGRKVKPGEFAENITVKGVDPCRAAILDRFRIGEAELELTQIGKKCHGSTCAIFREVGDCVMPRRGLFCRVLEPGSVRAGDIVEHWPRCFRIRIVTLSDRAFAGEYQDRSGREVVEILQRFFSDKHWHHHLESDLLPDDADRLGRVLREALQAGTDVVFTLGSTGVGPRDIAPETVLGLGGKTIPGIMENIRIKYGADKPSVFLSRSVAAVSGTTQIYTLPGSLKAVREYLEEILKTLEHTVYMLHGLDTH